MLETSSLNSLLKRINAAITPSARFSPHFRVTHLLYVSTSSYPSAVDLINFKQSIAPAKFCLEKLLSTFSFTTSFISWMALRKTSPTWITRLKSSIGLPLLISLPGFGLLWSWIGAAVVGWDDVWVWSSVLVVGFVSVGSAKSSSSLILCHLSANHMDHKIHEVTYNPSSSPSSSFCAFRLFLFSGTFLISRTSFNRSVTSFTFSASSDGVSKYLVSSGWGGPSGSLSRSGVRDAWKTASLIRWMTGFTVSHGLNQVTSWLLIVNWVICNMKAKLTLVRPSVRPHPVSHFPGSSSSPLLHIHPNPYPEPIHPSADFVP